MRLRSLLCGLAFVGMAPRRRRPICGDVPARIEPVIAMPGGRAGTASISAGRSARTARARTSANDPISSQPCCASRRSRHRERLTTGLLGNVDHRRRTSAASSATTAMGRRGGRRRVNYNRTDMSMAATNAIARQLGRPSDSWSFINGTASTRITDYGTCACAAAGRRAAFHALWLRRHCGRRARTSHGRADHPGQHGASLLRYRQPRRSRISEV